MRSLSLLLFVMATTALAQPAPKFDLEGHRGCRGLLPENTIPAFLKALDLGVNTLEMDVVISKDRQVVVSHEPYFNADFSILPNGEPVNKKNQKELNLYEMTYAAIERYDVGSNGNPNFPEQQKLKTTKPLLREVIRAAEAYRTQHKLPPVAYNIELKSEASEYNRSQPEPVLFCELVYAVITEQLPPERVVIQSFDFAILRHWKQKADAGAFKKMQLSALVEGLKGWEKHIADLGFMPDIYSPHFRLLSEKSIAEMHAKNIKVIPWTVNQSDDMNRLVRWGVDGLITDYPNRFTR
jgi:glycerophosphoryl diester phosphodiesterase